MKIVILRNDEYLYKVNENGEEILIRDEIIDNKKIKIILKCDKNRKFKRN